jgi:hypothetical protein
LVNFPAIVSTYGEIVLGRVLNEPSVCTTPWYEKPTCVRVSTESPGSWVTVVVLFCTVTPSHVLDWSVTVVVYVPATLLAFGPKPREHARTTGSR